jgi:hypothetical protein
MGDTNHHSHTWLWYDFLFKIGYNISTKSHFLNALRGGFLFLPYSSINENGILILN